MEFRRVKAKAIVTALIVFLVGVILLLLADVTKGLPSWLVALCTSLGALLVASVVLTLIFDSIMRPTFVEDILGHSETARQPPRGPSAVRDVHPCIAQPSGKGRSAVGLHP